MDLDGPLTLAVFPPAGTRDLKITLTFSADTEVFPPADREFSDQARAGKPYRVRWYPSDNGMVRVSTVPGARHGTVRVQWAALRDGWPADARPLPARPADIMPLSSSDATVVTGEQTLRW